MQLLNIEALDVKLCRPAKPQVILYWYSQDNIMPCPMPQWIKFYTQTVTLKQNIMQVEHGKV